MIDFPMLNDLEDDTDGDRFMTSVANITEDEDWINIFNLTVVKAIIDFRWKIIRPYAIWYTFFPWVLYVAIYTFFCFTSTE
jgi:hypothetical protein